MIRWKWNKTAIWYWHKAKFVINHYNDRLMNGLISSSSRGVKLELYVQISISKTSAISMSEVPFGNFCHLVLVISPIHLNRWYHFSNCDISIQIEKVISCGLNKWYISYIRIGDIIFSSKWCLTVFNSIENILTDYVTIS